MTVLYSSVKRETPGKPGMYKYFPTIRSYDAVKLHTLASLISEECSLTRSDVIAVIDALLRASVREAKAGRMIDLGDLGKFYLRARGGGKDRADAVRMGTGTNAKVHLYFRPGKELQDALKQLKFQKAPSKTKANGKKKTR